MKAVLLEVSHWHFPLYIKDLLDGGIEVVGFSDKSEEIRAKYSKLFRCDVLMIGRKHWGVAATILHLANMLKCIL